MRNVKETVSAAARIKTGNVPWIKSDKRSNAQYNQSHSEEAASADAPLRVAQNLAGARERVALFGRGAKIDQFASWPEVNLKRVAADQKDFI